LDENSSRDGSWPKEDVTIFGWQCGVFCRPNASESRILQRWETGWKVIIRDVPSKLLTDLDEILLWDVMWPKDQLVKFCGFQGF